MSLAEALITEEEGRRRHAYLDSEGYLTIGVGCLVDARKGGGLCDEAIDVQLQHDIDRARKVAAALDGFGLCNEARQAVLISMCFQLGSLSGWPKFRLALASGDFVLAAHEGLDSRWAYQTPRRARRQMAILRTGEWQDGSSSA